MIVNAVRGETDDASVESEKEEKKHDSSQRPHDAERPRGLSGEVHVGDVEQQDGFAMVETAGAMKL